MRHSSSNKVNSSKKTNDDDDDEIKYDNENEYLKQKQKREINSKPLSLPRNPSVTFENISKSTPKSPYNAFTHQIRKIIPEDIACSVGCGGSKCKYCNSNWPREDMDIDGVFSHWVTQDIIAMARPTTVAIEKYKIIEQMKKLKIKTIFNLEVIGEHKSCGPPLDKSGFSYDPNVFSSNGIFYYNFAIQDYKIASMSSLIDMVKVFCFAVEQGKVAVHCHAGLGRTGLFIACYLIYAYRMPANDAINYIRDKRQKAVQMNDQIEAILEFEKFLKPLRIVFIDIERDQPFTLNSFITRQRHFLHGIESRTLKYIPKVIYICVHQLKKLLNNDDETDNRPSSRREKLKKTSSEDADLEEELQKMSNTYVNDILNGVQRKLNIEAGMKNGSSGSLKSSKNNSSIVAALTSYSFDKKIIEKMKDYQANLNEKEEAYDKLKNETNQFVLVALMWSWLDQLQVPAIREQEIIVLGRSMHSNEYGDLTYNWDELDRCTLKTLDCILDLYRDIIASKKLTKQQEDEMICHLISILTHSRTTSMNVLHSQTSLNSYASDKEFNQENDYDDTQEKLVYHTNRLKRQYIHTLYQAIRILLSYSSDNSTKPIFTLATSSTDDDSNHGGSGFALRGNYR